MRSLREIWKACQRGLIGSNADLSLEERIFHYVCLIVISGASLNVPFDYLIGLRKLSLLMLGILCIAIFVYYLSRFKQRFTLAFVIFQVANLLALAINYYYNSGISGPTYMICLLSLILSVAIVPRKQYWLWLPLNVFIALSLLFGERMLPGLIINSYHHYDDRFIDFGYTYMIVAILVVSVLIAIRNAYHQQRARALVDAHQLAQSNETKNKLLSIIAHDLKEPMASIQSFLELLTEYPIDESERIDIEKQLLMRTQNASQMLANVLSWSRSQMNGVKVDLQQLRLEETLSETLLLSGSLAAEKGIEMVCSIPPHQCIYADADMLQLVVRNLLMNAVKFTFPGGKITLTAETNGIDSTITISDNGAGIPENKHAQLFTFSEKVTYGTAQEKGAGIGLVLCKNFMELQGGSIWFESEVGIGTQFFIRLQDCSVMLLPEDAEISIV